MNQISEKIRKLFNTGFFHIFGSSVVNKVITFMSSVVLVRILSKVEYGGFTYAWNIYSIILLLNGMGMDSAVLQLASEKSGNVKYGRNISRYGIKFGLRFDAILSLLILGIGFFAPLKIAKAKNLLPVLAFLPQLQLVYQISTASLRSQKRNKEFARLSVINTALVFIFSVLLAFLFREKGLIVSYYFSYLLSSIVGLRFCGYKVTDNRSNAITKEDRSILLKIAFISMVNNSLSQLMYLLDIFVLGIVDPRETILASYKVASMIPSALTFIPVALVTYIYPYFAEHNQNGEWCLKKYKQVLLGLGILNFIVSGILFLGAPLVIRLLYGIEYLDAVPVFRILSLNYFISGTFRTLSGNLLVTQRKLRFNLLVAIISSSTNIIADFFFVQKWGAMGAAYATVLVVVVSSILSTTYLIKTFKSKLYNSNT